MPSSIITKVGIEMGPDKKGLSARYIEEAVEASLKRLQVETIDLYLSHWPDETPHEETLGAYQKLIAKGKIRWCGASNFNAAQLSAALAASAKPTACRAMKSCSRSTISTTAPRSTAPLRDLCMARGDRRHHLFQPRQGLPLRQISLARPISARARAAAASRPISTRAAFASWPRSTPSRRSHRSRRRTVALAWLIARPGVTAPIASATSLPQLESLIRAATLVLSAGDIAALDEASAA